MWGRVDRTMPVEAVAFIPEGGWWVEDGASFSRHWIARVKGDQIIVTQDAGFGSESPEHVRLHRMVSYVEDMFRVQAVPVSKFYGTHAELAYGFDRLEVPHTIPDVCISPLGAMYCGIAGTIGYHRDVEYRFAINDLYGKQPTPLWQRKFDGAQLRLHVIDSRARDRHARCRAVAIIMMSYKIRRCIPQVDIRIALGRYIMSTCTNAAWDREGIAEPLSKRNTDE